MATSVKMDEETKSRLEELQAEIKLETGRKVTQQEILERLVTEAYESKTEFIDSFRETSLPLSEEEIDEFLSGTTASGDPVEEEDIDRILYDEEQIE
ncbi:hypothetical protein [Natronomonas amylolytica]|uniref:hypothetical protein n=1 Tax=Natronomonas amylolytica TaxID=3108498 RepID=UPI00300AD6A4